MEFNKKKKLGAEDKEICFHLTDIADFLDKQDLPKEAEVIDGIIEKIAQQDILFDILNRLNNTEFVRDAKEASEYVSMIKKMAEGLEGTQYNDVRNDIHLALNIMIDPKNVTDVTPILNRAKNNIIRYVQQESQKKAECVYVLIKTADTLDKKSFFKQSDKVEYAIDKIIKTSYMITDPSFFMKPNVNADNIRHLIRQISVNTTYMPKEWGGTIKERGSFTYPIYWILQKLVNVGFIKLPENWQYIFDKRVVDKPVPSLTQVLEESEKELMGLYQLGEKPESVRKILKERDTDERQLEEVAMEQEREKREIEEQQMAVKKKTPQTRSEYWREEQKRLKEKKRKDKEWEREHMKQILRGKRMLSKRSV